MTILFFSCTILSFSQENQKPFFKRFSPYGDLVVTPLMAYTISPKGSNIPTHFLVANGIKGNLGFELGFMYEIFTNVDDANAFFITGMSFHMLGFDYGKHIVNIGGQEVTNHRHNRFFLGLKFLPFKKGKFIALSSTIGLGNITTNFSSKNVNGKIKARSGDISISITIGLNKFIYK